MHEMLILDSIFHKFLVPLNILIVYHDTMVLDDQKVENLPLDNRKLFLVPFSTPNI
jgi:hypothetical protein